MIIVDIVVLVIAVIVVVVGALMALLINLAHPPFQDQEPENEFLPAGKSSLQASFSAIPERHAFMSLSRDPVNIEKYPFIATVCNQILEDEPDSLEFKCIATTISTYQAITGATCNVPSITRIWLRVESDYFWQGGRPMRVSSFTERQIFGSLLYTLYVDKPLITNIGTPISTPSYDTLDTHYSIELGGEMRPAGDVLAHKGMFEVEWKEDLRDYCGLKLRYCNQYYGSTSNWSKITRKIIEGLDERIECCHEGRLYQKVSEEEFKPHGHLNGRPLLRAHGQVVGMQTERKFPQGNEIKYFTVFYTIAYVDQSDYCRVSIPLYRRISSKKYFEMWFRYSGYNLGYQKARDDYEDMKDAANIGGFQDEHEPEHAPEE